MFKLLNIIFVFVPQEANSDASRAVELGAGAEAHLVQGKALFNLGRFVESLDAFNKGKAKGGELVNIKFCLFTLIGYFKVNLRTSYPKQLSNND